MSSVFAFLPNAGLGNKLFVWARAQAFASTNRLKCYTYGWTQPRIGPLLRGERRAIVYGAAFKGRLFEDARGLISLLSSSSWEYDPPVQPLDIADDTNRSFIYKELPHWSDYFIGIRDRRDELKCAFLASVKDRVLDRVATVAPPVVAVHLRRGDFRELGAGEDFAKVGLVRTSETYFFELIENVRNCAGTDLPVMVFSDGTDEECRPLTEICGVQRAPILSDVGDMILMSRAKVLITSAGSTFGMWSAFLSSAAVIVHPDHYHAPMRPSSVNERHFEGPAVGHWRTWSKLLIDNIKDAAASV